MSPMATMRCTPSKVSSANKDAASRATAASGRGASDFIGNDMGDVGQVITLIRGSSRLQPRADLARICETQDRKSTRLNSSHTVISYAVFCLKKKKDQHHDKVRTLHQSRKHIDSS